MTIDTVKDLCVIFGSFIASVSLIVGAFNVFQSRKIAYLARRTALWDSLFCDFQGINNYIAEKKIHIKTKPYTSFFSGPECGMLIFHHLNLLYKIYLNRSLLSSDEKIGFERWKKDVFYEWILSDQELSKDFVSIISRKDLLPDNFLSEIHSDDSYSRILKNCEKQNRKKALKGSKL